MKKAEDPESIGGVEPQAIETKVSIKPLQERTAIFQIHGLAPYVQLRFGEKTRTKMRATHEAGQQARSRRKKEPRSFQADFVAAMYQMPDGSHGIPATAFRNAMISACRLVGFKMTIAKLSVFVEPDGFDATDLTPLVRIAGTPESKTEPVRNASGVTDLRVRALWREWSATVRVRWDTDQFSLEDVTNLMVRAGKQVGIGEGRPDSKMSAGLGRGLFEVKPAS